MDLGIKGKRAVVTGSTAGIGLAIATTLAREGASVLLNGRTQSRVDEAIVRIKKDVPGAQVTGVASDMSTAAGCDIVVRAAADAEILVNNVGIFEIKPFGEIPDADWMRFFETNVLSGVRMSRALLPGMLKRNWGRIVFISSESAVQIPTEMIHYGMTKTAQLAIARGIAELTAGTGVTVNSVLPGPTGSEGVGAFVESMAKQRGVDKSVVEKDFFQTARPTSLIKRFATTEEVAAMVAYVCSTSASATNGASLRVDGGVVKTIV